MFYTRAFQASDKSFFLLGPRGTGKSTWLKQRYPDATIINLLKPDILRLYLAKPERLYEIVRASKSNTIIIDEIQKAPNLLDVVHDLIEENKKWQFILTGSSARKLKKDGINLLAGRLLMKNMHPMLASEMQKDFTIENALQYGMVPLIIDSDNSNETLKAYVGLYLEEEVKSESLVRNIGDFSRFLEVVSFSHGCILNISNIARECAVSRKLIEGYLNILNDLMLSYHLPVFTVRAKRSIIAHSKFYYFDTGVYKNLRLTGFLDNNTEIDGPGLEGLVLQHIKAWNDYRGSSYKVYYWRTKHGVEVDFILYGNNSLWAIEVKNTKHITRKDIKNLKAFKQDYPEAQTILLYRGNERCLVDNTICMPVQEFLLNPII